MNGDLRRDEIRPKLVKNPAADCLAMVLGGELSCDLPRNHEPPHYDAEYRMSFTVPDEVPPVTISAELTRPDLPGLVSSDPSVVSIELTDDPGVVRFTAHKPGTVTISAPDSDDGRFPIEVTAADELKIPAPRAY